EVSVKEIHKVIKEKIESEDNSNPYTDEQLSAFLKEKGYIVARRTVAKYREQLEIPIARLRKN
ncbi:MAG: RNA polymerase sigma-54 factor, partial [Anaerotignum sp.]|nr:RNA polymerase sigma-54 factor [Anaerotignum sp.]